MSISDKYFTFPLVVLHGNTRQTTPLACLELAMNYGIWSAGRGFRNNHGGDKFEGKLTEICDNLSDSDGVDLDSDEAEVLVGASICNVRLGSNSDDYLAKIAKGARSVQTGGPLVRMASRFLWAALDQARHEAGSKNDWPEHGISWREFRVLSAILSVPMNRYGFSFIGWETIEARACGYAKRVDFNRALTGGTLPDHLEHLTRKMIRLVCDQLENLGFYARFRLSKGPRGGRMAYSFRHDRGELAKVVCESSNFRDRVRIAKNREEDQALCRDLLDRAKHGPSMEQPKGQDGGQG